MGDEVQWVVLDSMPEVVGPNQLRFEFTIEDEGRFDCLAGPGIRDPLVPVAFGSTTAAPVPTMSAFMQVLLASVLGMFGLLGLRRSKMPSSRSN